jgi:hypothetical protein
MTLPGWSDWSELSQPTFVPRRDPSAGLEQIAMHPLGLAVGQNAIGCLHVFCIDAPFGNLQHIQQVRVEGAWGDWQAAYTSTGDENPDDWSGLPQSRFIPPVAVTRNFDGRLEIFCVDLHGQLWHACETQPATHANPAPPWSELMLLGADAAVNGFATMAAASHPTDGHLHVFYLTAGGLINNCFQSSPGSGDWLSGIATEPSGGGTSEFVPPVEGPSPLQGFDPLDLAAGLSGPFLGDAPPIHGLNSWLLMATATRDSRLMCVGNFASFSSPLGRTYELAPVPARVLDVQAVGYSSDLWSTPIEFPSPAPLATTGWLGWALATGWTSQGATDVFTVDCSENLWCATQDFGRPFSQQSVSGPGSGFFAATETFTEYDWAWQQLPMPPSAPNPFKLAACSIHVTPDADTAHGDALMPVGYRYQMVFSIAADGSGVQICVGRSYDQGDPGWQESWSWHFPLGGGAGQGSRDQAAYVPTCLTATTVFGESGERPTVFTLVDGVVNTCALLPAPMESLEKMGLPTS